MLFRPHSCKNRWELLAIYAYIFVALGLNQVTFIVTCWLVFYTNYGLYLVLAYFVWIYLDRHTCETGGRRADWFRNSVWWKYHRSYFPINLHKTADLPADRNYLLAIFPHCVLSAGAFSAFTTDRNDFQKLFPGLVPYLATLRIMFFLPVVREFIIMAGLISPSERSINWVLGSPGVGRVCAIVAGGAAEAVYSEPGVYKTVLDRRRGFCRVALKNGSDLVPVIPFGEVDLYTVRNPAPGSLLETLQIQIKNLTTVYPVWFIGEGFMSLVPKPVPINIVVGSPIPVQKIENPTNEQVDELHAKLRSGLVRLFNAEKHKYLADPTTELIFV